MKTNSNKEIKKAKLELKQRLLEHTKGLETGTEEMEKAINQLSKLDKVNDGSISKDTYVKVGGSIVAGLLPVAVKYLLSKKG
jgi:hypothetical protein